MQPSEAPALCSIVAALQEWVLQGAHTEERVPELPVGALNRHLDLERCHLRLLLFSCPHHTENEGSKDGGSLPCFISVCTGVSAVGVVYLR